MTSRRKLAQVGGRRRPCLPGLLDRGGGPEKGAGEELHPDQRRSRPARAEERESVPAGRSHRRVIEFREGQSRGVLRLADGAREPAVRPRGRQPALAVALRRGPAQDARATSARWAGRRRNPRLLDWLAAEFVAPRVPHEGDAPADRHLETSTSWPRRSTRAGPATEIAADPENAHLWHFRLRRLEAEPIWDAIFFAAKRPRPHGRRPVVRRRPDGGATVEGPPADGAPS